MVIGLLTNAILVTLETLECHLKKMICAVRATELWSEYWRELYHKN